MRRADLDTVLAVQRACYGPGFVESAAVFARRLAAAPRTAWVAQRRGGGARDKQSAGADAGPVCAYLCACPARLGALTALGGDFAPAGPAADTLYLHDLAVHPDAHGAGLGPQLVRTALAHAARRGWRHAALVSVQGSQAFWQRLGFEARALDDAAQRARLAHYPGDACYMVRET